MTKDDNKGITAISYRHLNLPFQVNKGASDYILYIYDAMGRKLTQQVFGATTKKTDYMGEFIYENDILQFINHEEGRILPATSGNSTYQYHLKDHLGNVRLTFSEASTSTPFQATFERTRRTSTESPVRFYVPDERECLRKFGFSRRFNRVEFPQHCCSTTTHTTLHINPF